MSTGEDSIRSSSAWKRRALILIAVAAVLALFEPVRQQGRAMEARVEDGRTVLNVALVWWEYANTHNGALPPLDPRPGVLLFDESKVRKGYALGPVLKGNQENPGAAALFGDLNGNFSYTLKDLADAKRFFYLGYGVTNDAEGLSLIEAYRRQIESGGDFTADLSVEKGRGTLGSDSLRMLHFNLPGILAAAGLPLSGAVPRIPVLIERPTEKEPRGGWVVYLDRQMTWMPYPGPFPMTKQFIEGLEGLTDLQTKKP
ncbi:MAG: hypothetical protein K1Y02_05915 [Candidatus Hydrogenedentes bacterium]|nr:hypothetical protein [Candidatus Hydrogenedentota bacterium]